MRCGLGALTLPAAAPRRFKQEALDLIERAFARGWGKRDWLERDPDYDSLRDDPRFQRLLATIK